jgi:hypothetical protein
MTEPQKADHWAVLATDLGAQPAPEEPKPAVGDESTAAELSEAEDMTWEGDPQPEAVVPAPPPPPVIRPVAKPVTPSRRPARPSAWDQLPGELGITVSPPPPQPIASVATPGFERGKLEPRAVEPETTAEPPNVVPEVALPWAELEPTVTEPKPFEPQEALDFMDDTSDEFGNELPEGSTAPGEARRGEPQEDEQRSRRRRRRRGRGRGREEREGRGPSEAVAGGASAPHAGEAPAASSELESGTLGSELIDSGTESAGPQPAEEAAAEGDRSERRGRRRRGRGRGRGRNQARDDRPRSSQPRDEHAPEAEGDFDDVIDFDDVEEDRTLADVGLHAEEGAAGHEGDEHDFDDDHDLDHEDDEDGGESPRIGFRNIPTWNDAIGVMIAKNMEARARNPGGSRGPGGRGGRGGGRGRGRRPDRR